MKSWTKLATNIFGGRKADGAVTARVSSTRGEEQSVIIYEGLIDPEKLRWIEDIAHDGFRYAIEVRDFPHHDWYGATLLTQTWWHTGEDCMGNAYSNERKSTLHRLIRMSSDRDEKGNPVGGGFIFFNNVADYDIACIHLIDLIIDKQPFKTRVNF